MNFTSGGAPGPRLDQQAIAAQDLGNNVCGFLTSAKDAQHAADTFRAGGWSVRASSWDEFEVEHTFARLELLPIAPVTFSGFVDPARIDTLLTALTSLGLSWTVEYEHRDGTEQLFRSAHG
ncbi:hypothetical protein [Streptomyces sp. H39-S7]|uniref:hypothetical protein n=1 Tax=Streptomyces sp. H39-S7 TaxID=3004357 RepID=UPI0022AEA790|nr:hypothetical protein [Streptomyces sp. H39-S7]MCZ4120314.1 hypothetical protein [Streptomyces sp. H39-S7]